jgi:hypothetical protein
MEDCHEIASTSTKNTNDRVLNKRKLEMRQRLPVYKSAMNTKSLSFLILIPMILLSTLSSCDAQIQPIPLDASCGIQPAGCDLTCQFGYKAGFFGICSCACYDDPCKVCTCFRVAFCNVLLTISFTHTHALKSCFFNI